MTDYILVGIGGALGSIARYGLGRVFSGKAKTKFPFGTFLINITGAFLLGIVSTIQVNGNISLLMADGFLGAYTTFSTFMYEGFNLFQENKKLNAVMYISGTMVIGIVGFVLGVKVAGSIR
jgi:CrcB protein